MSSTGRERRQDFPQYVQPSTGVFAIIPRAWIPYAELMRLQMFIGVYSMYVPHLIGTLWAAVRPGGSVSYHQLLHTNLVLFIGTIFMRGAAVAFNDVVDQDYDRRVARCSIRPVARGAVSTAQGHTFTAALAVIALALLVQLPAGCQTVAMPSVFLLWFYPFTKRITDYPQLVLGLQISLNVFMGIAAMGVRPIEAFCDASAWALYFSFVAWTVVYDTVYARQDVLDDEKAGVRSIAVKFAGHTMALLQTCAAFELCGLIAMGVLLDLGWVYFVVGCGGTALGLGVMLLRVKLDDPEDCFWWFCNAYWQIGAPLGFSLLLEYIAK